MKNHSGVDKAAEKTSRGDLRVEPLLIFWALTDFRFPDAARECVYAA
jgi:hypothetical protein